MSCNKQFAVRKKGGSRTLVNNITEKIGEFLSESKINLSELSRKSGVPYKLLYSSVWDNGRKRDLRANELMSICIVLGITPMDFVESKK